MSHPQDRYQRFTYGDRKGQARARGKLLSRFGGHTEEDRQELLKRLTYLSRNTTKRCSCCGNPRRNGWCKKKSTIQERRLEGELT